MKIFRRGNANKPKGQHAQSQSMAISDPNAFLKSDASIIIGYGLTDNMNPNWKGPMPPEQANELIRQVNKLKEQNNHLNKYILELVKENETLQDRLSDMKVTL